MAESVVQYPYALDESNKLVFIEDVDRETRREHLYHCPNCGQKMEPRQGEHNAWHFAHDHHKCGVESYVHKTAKYIIKERFNDSNKSFVIGLSTKRQCMFLESCNYRDGECNCHSIYKEYDLKQYYDLPAEEEITVPTTAKGTLFRPDVLLRSNSPKRKEIFIEVFHKSRSKEKKINSGYPIIEIHIKDLIALRHLETFICLKESKDICFYNFKSLMISPEQIEKEIRDNLASNDVKVTDYVLPPCKRSEQYKRNQQPLRRYILYKSGKSFDSGIYESELNYHHSSALLDITYNTANSLTAISPERILAKKFMDYRTCSFCHHCLTSPETDITWCNIRKNGSSRKGTFDMQKGTYCSFFEWRPPNGIPNYMYESDLYKEPVEGVDYVIWINS
jgi:hypothetical protein